MTRSQQASAKSRVSQKPNVYSTTMGVVWRFIRFFIHTALILLIGLIINIVTEWIGMTVLWPELGSGHARQMYQAESQYLADDFSMEIAGVSPSAQATRVANSTVKFLHAETKYEHIKRMLDAPRSHTDTVFMEMAKNIRRASKPYLVAANDIVVVYMVRLTIVAFTLPMIIVAAIVAAQDGFVERIRRTAGGGRESAIRHAYSAFYLSFFTVGPFLLYLAWPVAIHPMYMIIPILLAIVVLVRMIFSNLLKFL